MGKDHRIVRVSSKGQIVIPIRLRRQARIRSGDVLAVRKGAGREIIFTPLEDAARNLDRVLLEARSWFAAWAKKTGRDPLEELHQRRRLERKQEASKRERWGH